jgi:hypothetical protein
MSSTPRPHDLVWLNNAAALEAIEESWVAQHWRISLPVVVRRDVDANARIPVGVRGMKRDQRAAGWVQRKISSVPSARKPSPIANSSCARRLSPSRRFRRRYH